MSFLFDNNNNRLGTYDGSTLTLITNSTNQASVDTNGRVSVRKGSVALSSSNAKVGGTTYVSTTTVNNVGGSPTDAYVHTVAGNTLANDGDRLVFDTGGTFAWVPGSTTLEVKVTFGSTLIATLASLSSQKPWRIQGVIIRTGATTVKVCLTVLELDEILSRSPVIFTTATETLSSDLTLKLTLEDDISDTVIAEYFTEQWLPAA